MSTTIFIQLALILGLSSVLGFACFKLKLPVVIAYLLTGVIIASAKLFNISQPNILTFLPNIGIAFVLFLTGMELNLRELHSLGRPVVVTSITQIIISTIAGYLVASFFGFNQTESLLLGFGLSFSSTVVIIKLLSDKKDLMSLYGKLSLGITLVEDLVAIIVLMMISLGSSIFAFGLQSSFPIITLVIKAIVLFSLSFLLSKYVLDKVFKAVAKSSELLFLASLTWCFIFTSVAVLAGFSIVIGAFLAGVALASSPYDLQIQGKIRPLRDFFVSLFFVYLGSQVNLVDILVSLPVIFIFSAYTILAKPIIFLLVLGIFGFRKHTLFQTALSLSQISEFSLVILLLGISSIGIHTNTLSIMAMVGVTSIIISSIMITYSKNIYPYVLPFLGFFELKTKVHFLENHLKEAIHNHVVVIGAHRVGGPVVEFLHKEKIPFLVLEFNPTIIEELSKKGIKAIYGDARDHDILDHLSLETAKLIISTANDPADTEVLLRECRKRRVSAFIVARAQESDDAKVLKDLGADYIIMPEHVSGDFLVEKIKSSWLKLS